MIIASFISFWSSSGLFSYDQTVEVATGEISEHFEGVEYQDLAVKDSL